MIEKLKSIAFVFPVMVYYLFEAIIVALFITVIWNTVLIDKFGRIGYFQWVTIYWIIKMLLFDVFKLISSLNSGGINIPKENESDKYYNEQFEE
jgi:general stress protein CsbA